MPAGMPGSQSWCASAKSLLFQVILGNLLSHTDMQRAARGVDYMYFSFAVQDGLLEASTIAAVVAAEAGALGMPASTPH